MTAVIRLKNSDEIKEFLASSDRPDQIFLSDFIYWYIFGNAKLVFQCSDREADTFVPLLWGNLVETGAFHEDDEACVYEPDTDDAIMALSGLYELNYTKRRRETICLDRKGSV